MVKLLEQMATDVDKGVISLRNAEVMAVKSEYRTLRVPIRDYQKLGATDKTVYACDAVCDNCHCATY